MPTYKAYAALVAVVKRNSLFNDLAFRKTLVTQVIFKYSIRCAIITVLKGYISFVMGRLQGHN